MQNLCVCRHAWPGCGYRSLELGKIIGVPVQSGLPPYESIAAMLQAVKVVDEW